MSVRTYRRFYHALHCGTHSTYAMPAVLCRIDDATGIRLHKHLLAVHLVLGQIFHVDITEITQPAVHRDVSKIHALDFKPLHQLPREMKSGRRGCHRSLVTGKNTLKTFHILGFGRTLHNMFGQRSLAERI